MRFRFSRVVILVVAGAAAAGLAAAQASQPPRPTPPLTVHEWGTFTSIAGEDGRAVQWLPQGGQSDLPCFVERSGFIKGALWGTVRMETPVLYFYAPREVAVGVTVGFRQGLITEWFPHATVGMTGAYGTTHQGTASWPDVRVLPGQAEAFPTESGPSHYYKARGTDAAPIRVSGQTEKFIFYRGVGTFAPPISATVRTDGKVEVWSAEQRPLGDLILFENRRGAMAYNVKSLSTSRATLDRPALDDAGVTPERELVRILVAHGLYKKEAEAMVETWSDSWFEEGARLLYIAPRAAVDAIVPLTITPTPIDVARVFVGRMELVTPVTRSDVRLALATNDRQMLEKYGRFLQPIAGRVLAEVSPLDRDLLASRLKTVAANWETPKTSCGNR
jgi:hypothetical protein